MQDPTRHAMSDDHVRPLRGPHANTHMPIVGDEVAEYRGLTIALNLLSAVTLILFFGVALLLLAAITT